MTGIFSAGSEPLSKPAHEAFAQALARAGRGGAASAYRTHVARKAVTDESAKSAAYSLARRSAVAARIDYLRGALAAEAAVAAEAVTEEAVTEAMALATSALGELQKLATRRGEDPTVVLRLRRVLSAHSGRLSYAEAGSTDDFTAAALDLAAGAPPDLPPIPPLVRCSCPPAGEPGAS